MTTNREEMNMAFEKLPPVEKIHVGCLTCSTAARIAPMDMLIAVGFGAAYVLCDDKPVYEEDSEFENMWTVQDAENAALADPDHDWRIVKHGPLHGETFQRHGPGEWVCVESNEGFA
jgi:hypothetical protein